MKKFKHLFWVAIASVLMSCGGGVDYSNYESCALAFTENIISLNNGDDKGSMKVSYELSCFKGELMSDKNKDVFGSYTSKVMISMRREKNCKIIRSAEMGNGNTAFVEFSLLSNGGRTSSKIIILTKIDGEWKVDINALINAFISKDEMTEFEAKTAK